MQICLSASYWICQPLIGGNKRQGGVGPVRGPGRLPAARGRGCRPAGHPPSLSVAVKKRRMKRLFPDDEDVCPEKTLLLCVHYLLF